MVRQVVDENGGEVQYTDVCEFLVKQMLGKFHPTDLQLMQVDKLKQGRRLSATLCFIESWPILSKTRHVSASWSSIREK